MPISFPTNPVLNQTYTYNGKTWLWNGTTWEATTLTPGPEIMHPFLTFFG